MSNILSAERIQELEIIIGYEFEDKNLLELALQAAGFGPHPEGNKRLALIGDAALRLVLYLGGYEANAPTSQMTQSQNTHATNANLAQIGFARGIDKFILLHPSAQGVVQHRGMATSMEAILGAIYLDSLQLIAAVHASIIHLGLTDSA